MTDPAHLTVTEARRAITAGKLDPVDLMEACLDRIAAREPSVRAFAAIDPSACRAAAAAGRAAAANLPLGGIPIGVKDVLDTADLPTGYGSVIWEGWRPRADAACVAWSQVAGAVVIGKTVTTEFATRTPGPTANPRGLGHTPGGSSSGSAAAVADLFCPVAFGTQTAGSVIRPAAYCGVVGYKPTFGLIDRVGMKLMSVSLDTIGLMTRSVADCALVAGVLSGYDLGDPEAAPPRMPSIGVCQSAVWHHASPETQALLHRAADACRRAGATVTESRLPEVFDAVLDAHPRVMNHESARAMGWELAHHRDQISAALMDRLDFGMAQTEAQMRSAYAAFETGRAVFGDAMREHDVLITPSAPAEAPEGLHHTGEPTFNSLWTSLGVPCVTVPVGTGPAGMPLGLQIVGRRGDDRAVLAWARWIEAAIG